ncbi:differentially expressed in FDCP 6 homolog [Amia ocellicauda]|uniref:differentially expressed in FDCP 6 homolog n=1 Tax=Amia ocellicauda TaxID=2972642 RepID=UPI0034648014
MDFKAELLKSIWYAFTSLDVEKSGKVSKSQLKVLSHNLYTALKIPHDPVALEEHFRDDDDGPVSNQGYMPYLNKYILAKAKEGTFDKETFDDLCWMMTSKKNFNAGKVGICSQRDCFKLFCLFNILSEDRYPLVMIPEEVEYLMKKITGAMSMEWNCKELDDLYSQNIKLKDGMSVWIFLEQMNSGNLLNITNIESFSLALDDVFQEMYHNVLKKGYMWKKGHMRRNWNERWFVLKPAIILYYVSEDLKDKKGEIVLDRNCVVESIPDKEGKRCLFCVKTTNRTYEISASDQKQRLDWMQAIQTAVRLLSEGKMSLHQELKLRRREQREQSPRAREELQALQDLQEEKEKQEQEMEQLLKIQQECEEHRRREEERGREQQQEVQRALERQLEEAERVRESMAAEIVLKEQEAERQRRRIQELELTQQRLEIALDTEIHARLEEERARMEQERLLQEEEEKLKQLKQLKEEQEVMLMKAQLEKNKMKEEVADKVQAFEMASRELRNLQETRQKSNLDLKEAKKRLRRASRHVKHWNVQLNRLMQPISPGDHLASTQCNKHLREEALASKEFDSRQHPIRRPASRDSGSSSSEEEDLQELLETLSLASSKTAKSETNGQGL